MGGLKKEKEFDVIVIGSGTAGATIARELTRENKKVLILERGANKPLKETFFTLASIVNEVRVSDKLSSMRAMTTGGSSSLYAAIAELPPLDTFLSLDIDLSQELVAVQKELPIATLPDELLGNQALKLRESALALGHPWQKSPMLIDQSKCDSGYSYDAKWKAKSYVIEAVEGGATLINNAVVQKVIVEKNQAIGVDYKIGNKNFQAYGARIVVAAGVLETPTILQETGIKNIANHGFYCNPGFLMFGSVAGLKGKDTFVGCMSADIGDDIVVGDANLPRTFYQIIMLASLKFSRLFSFPNSIATGVVVKDGVSGGLKKDGTYYKQLTQEEHRKLKKGEEVATKILKNAGAKNIFRSPIDAGNVGGTLRIHEHLDAKLQTEYSNLYVCDGSVIPDDIRVYPTVTLICLGKYLAKHLLATL